MKLNNNYTGIFRVNYWLFNRNYRIVKYSVLVVAGWPSLLLKGNTMFEGNREQPPRLTAPAPPDRLSDNRRNMLSVLKQLCRDRPWSGPGPVAVSSRPFIWADSSRAALRHIALHSRFTPLGLIRNNERIITFARFTFSVPPPPKEGIYLTLVKDITFLEPQELCEYLSGLKENTPI